MPKSKSMSTAAVVCLVAFIVLFCVAWLALGLTACEPPLECLRRECHEQHTIETVHIGGVTHFWPKTETVCDCLEYKAKP